MALPAVQGSSLPEAVCGKDERVQVDPMTSPPYKWICSLLIESARDVMYIEVVDSRSISLKSIVQPLSLAATVPMCRSVR